VYKKRHNGLDQIILSRQLGSVPERKEYEEKSMKIIALGKSLAASAPRKSRIDFLKVGVYIVFDARMNEFEVLAETT